MRKLSFVLLLIPVLFLSACSVKSHKNSSENVLDESEASQYTSSDNQIDSLESVFEESQISESATLLNNTSEPESKLDDNSFLYKNNDYQFQITFPSIWKEVVVRTEEGSMSLINPNNANDNKINFVSRDLVFGFPIEVTYQDNQVFVKDCLSCFEEVFRLQILSKEDSREFEVARDLNIQEYGSNPLNNYRIVTSNNNYVFYGPTNFFGQSYDGEFIKNRQTEAQEAISNQFVVWN